MWMMKAYMRRLDASGKEMHGPDDGWVLKGKSVDALRKSAKRKAEASGVGHYHVEIFADPYMVAGKPPLEDYILEVY